jgi:hypothetical protein
LNRRQLNKEIYAISILTSFTGEKNTKHEIRQTRHEWFRCLSFIKLIPRFMNLLATLMMYSARPAFCHRLSQIFFELQCRLMQLDNTCFIDIVEVVLVHQLKIERASVRLIKDWPGHSTLKTYKIDSNFTSILNHPGYQAKKPHEYKEHYVVCKTFHLNIICRGIRPHNSEYG